MKAIHFLIITLLVSFMSFNVSSNDAILGKWKAADGNIVTITKVNKELLGIDDKGKKVFYDFHLENGVWFATSATGKASCEFNVEGNTLGLIVRLGIFKKSFSFTKV
jgi:hypothetical protein